MKEFVFMLVGITIGAALMNSRHAQKAAQEQLLREQGRQDAQRR